MESSLKQKLKQEGVPLAGVELSLSIVNPTSKETARLGVHHLKTGRIIAHLNRSDIGQLILKEARDDNINLTLSVREDVPRGLMGVSYGIYGTAYVRNTQSYKETVITLIHEGIHALGVEGSRRAEAIARLAELRHEGTAITQKTIKQVLTDIRSVGAYNHLPWRVGKKSKYFPDLSF